ncbi:hypothetical protein CSOJ01_07026 [Colletotrichum sojae]|uniref:Uncharacterized protein n=1 Tax=Colletotrichum sojae TaxID=2175907 RepID=A0A8H6JAP7_9PEZI|nr:hypothetical protein CSOJ01_07026 [Colletotrichum sojae]
MQRRTHLTEDSSRVLSFDGRRVPQATKALRRRCMHHTQDVAVSPARRPAKPSNPLGPYRTLVARGRACARSGRAKSCCFLARRHGTNEGRFHVANVGYCTVVQDDAEPATACSPVTRPVIDGLGSLASWQLAQSCPSWPASGAEVQTQAQA